MKSLRLESSPTRNHRLNEVLGMMVVVAGVMLLLALASYQPGDPSLNTVAAHATGHVHNWAGRVGAGLSDVLLQLMGVAAFALPLMVVRLGLCWVRSRSQGSPLARIIGFVLWVAAAPIAFALLPGAMRYKDAMPVGGTLGTIFAGGLLGLVNYPGSWVCVALALLLSTYLSTTFTFSTAREWATERVGLLGRLQDMWLTWRNRRTDAKEAAQNETRREREFARQQAAEQKAQETRRAARNGSLLAGVLAKWGFWRRGIRADGDAADAQPAVSRSLFSQIPRTDVDAGPAPEFAPLPAHLQKAAEAQLRSELAEHGEVPAQAGFEDWDAPASEQPARQEQPFDWMEAAAARAPRAEVVPFPVRRESAGAAPEKLVSAPVAEVPAPPKEISFGKRADENLQPVAMTAKSIRGYKLPPSSLLYRSEEHASVREDALREEARVLVQKCGEFGVDGQVTQINPGPVVTTFEFRPDAGVKYSRVTGLADDLCLAMAAESILIERMAGKSTVGIQVPNHERETIWLRDVVESEHFATSKSRLAIAMGKDINGRIVTADLASMPHVLIAGSTGSGKSVAINAMIMSVLFKATPEQVRMILVDPKRGRAWHV